MKATPKVPPGWSADGWPFWEPWAGEWEDPEEHSGLWHVTTAAPRVLKAGRLLSRQQLGATQGLGGGIYNVAPSTVSVVTRSEDALRLVRAMQVAALAAQDRIPAWAVAWEAVESSNWHELEEAAEEVLSRLEDDAAAYEDEDVREKADDFEADLRRNAKCMEEIWGDRVPTERRLARSWGYGLNTSWRRGVFGSTRFDLIRAIESCADELRQLVLARDEQAVEYIAAPVGFTTAWVDVNPRHVRVLRLAGRVGARTDVEPAENELRFKPDDLLLLGVVSPRGLVRVRPGQGRASRHRRRRRRW